MLISQRLFVHGIFAAALAVLAVPVQAKNSVIIDVDMSTVVDVGGSEGQETRGRRADAKVSFDGTDLVSTKTLIFKGMSANNDQQPLVFKKLVSDHQEDAEDTETTHDFYDAAPGIWRGVLVRQNMVGYATVYQDSTGSIAASINVNGEVFDLNTLPDGRVCVKSLLSEDLAEEAKPDMLIPSDRVGGRSRKLLRGARSANELNAVHQDRTLQQGYVTIHILAVVEHAAMCAEAGQNVACSSNSSNRGPIERKLRIAEDDMNDALATAGAATRVRIIDMYFDQSGFKSSGYQDTAAARSDTQIRDHLTNPNDGVLDFVHWLRDTRGGDLTILITNSGGPGVAHFALDKSVPANYGFAIVRRDQLAAYTLSHELGHLFGCFHDRDNALANSAGVTIWPPAPYDTLSNYGFSAPQINRRTLMAYDCDISQLGYQASAGCTGVKYFSSSTGTFPGTNVAIGDAQNDNAKKVRETGPMLAAFRAPGSFSMVNPTTGKAIDISSWASCADSSNAQLWDFNGQGGQVFHFDNNDVLLLDHCDKALDLHNANCNNQANIQLWSKNGNGGQKFRHDPVSGKLWNDMCYNRVLDIQGFGTHNGASIVSHEFVGGWNQAWRLVWKIKTNSPKFSIVNPQTNKALDVSGWETCQSGSNIQLWDRNNGGGQVFRFNTQGQIVLDRCPTLVLDVADGKCDNGTNIRVVTADGNKAKKFWYDEVENTIVSELCNKRLDIFGFASHNGANVVLWEATAGTNQEWKIVWQN